MKETSLDPVMQVLGRLPKRVPEVPVGVPGEVSGGFLEEAPAERWKVGRWRWENGDWGRVPSIHHHTLGQPDPRLHSGRYRAEPLSPGEQMVREEVSRAEGLAPAWLWNFTKSSAPVPGPPWAIHRLCCHPLSPVTGKILLLQGQPFAVQGTPEPHYPLPCPRGQQNHLQFPLEEPLYLSWKFYQTNGAPVCVESKQQYFNFIYFLILT